MHAKHTKQAGQARYANQANQAGRQGKPGRAQAVATQLSPISKLDVFLFATYILSTGSQNVYLFFCLIHTLAGTSSVNAAIANFKIGRLSVCDMYIFSTGSQHVYPFFGHTNTLAATIGGNAATANFKIGSLSICDVYLLHRISKCISFLSPYS